MLYYDPEYKLVEGGAQGPPNWIYFTQVQLHYTNCELACLKSLNSWAAGLFMYQSLDAIDG